MRQEFYRDYLLRLPLPLAQLYGRAHNAKDARSRHDNTFYLFEALVKLAAAPAVAAYLQEVHQGAPRVPALDQLLAQLALPSLGQWLAILRELARHFGHRPDAASHPLGHLWGQLDRRHRDLDGALALYRRIKNGPDGAPAEDQSCSLLQLLGALVQYRNAVFGHGAGRFESFYEREMGPLLFPAVNDVLAEGVFDLLGPRGSRLVHLTEVRLLDEGRAEVGIRELIGTQGERSTPLALAAAQLAELAPGHVALLWPGRPVPLRLDPLLLYREGELAEEVLFLNRDRDGRQVEYLSYTTGRAERDRSTAPALAALLSRITDRAVTAEHLEELAERSRAETPSVEPLFATPAVSGRRLGDYELLAELGRGGMGVVYLARQLALGRLVALKMLPADLAGDEVALARFRREVRALARCEHPNIVKVLASGTLPDGQPFYAMEYVPGCDLESVWREVAGTGAGPGSVALGQSTWARAVLAASRKRREQAARSADPTSAGGLDRTSPGGPAGNAPARPSVELPLPPLPELPELPDDPGGYARRVAQLGRDAALALQAVHDQHLIHRDLKPANLMLTADGTRVVLMDFGLAKGQSLSGAATRAGGLLGTLRYAAPEQLAAARLGVGPAADVRGLGVTLWELLTRRRLFAEAEDEKQLAQMVHENDVPRLRAVDPGLDRDLEAIVARATERRVADRIPTAGRLAEYLQLYLDGKPLPIRPPGSAELVRRWLLRHKAVVGLAVACVLCFVFAAASYVLHQRARVQQAHDFFVRGMQYLAEEDTRAELCFARALTLEDRPETRYRLLQARSRSAPSVWEAEAPGSKPLAVSDDARWLLVRGQDGLDLWGLPERAEVRHIDTGPGQVLCAAFSPDGKRLLVGKEGGKILLLRRSSAAVLATCTLPSRADVLSLAFSPDGGRFASGDKDRAVVVWDARGKVQETLRGHTDKVVCLAFSPAGDKLASGSWDNWVRVWDLQTKKGTPLHGHDDAVLSLAFSRDGKLLASGGWDNYIVLWDVETGRKRLLKGHRGGVTALRFGTGDASAGENRDSALLASGSEDHTVRLWDVESAVNLLTLPGHRDTVAAVAFDAQRRLTAAAEDGGIRQWDLAAAGNRPELATLVGHTAPASVVAFSPDSSRLVSGGWDGSLRLWELESRATVWARRHDGAADDLPNGITSAAFSPDGRWVATGSKDHTARVWDAVTGAPVQVLQHHDQVRRVLFSPDGRQLATGCDDGRVSLWDVATWTKTAATATTAGKILGLCYRPDGGALATAEESGAISVWELPGLRLALRIGGAQGNGHREPVWCVAYTPDGRRLVSASDDHTSRVFDAETGDEVVRVNHAGAVWGVAVSPDGRLFASAGQDAAVLLWAADGRRRATLRVSRGPVWWVAFSPDGRKLAWSSVDRMVRVVDLAALDHVLHGPPAELLREAEAQTGLSLAETEPGAEAD